MLSRVVLNLCCVKRMEDSSKNNVKDGEFRPKLRSHCCLGMGETQGRFLGRGGGRSVFEVVTVNLVSEWIL